mmetsp:Transcript_7708/g.24241  ORF Transcript_7708/g.24241 Transcript_7708/m.24241 type:complete len:80 (+) Transcript_7708:636-875(+)
MQDSSMLPQGHIEHTPLCAWGKAHPQAVRNGLLRCESAAETTSWGSGSRNAFLQKLCICVKCCPCPTGTQSAELRKEKY